MGAAALAPVGVNPPGPGPAPGPAPGISAKKRFGIGWFFFP